MGAGTARRVARGLGSGALGLALALAAAAPVLHPARAAAQSVRRELQEESRRLALPFVTEVTYVESIWNAERRTLGNTDLHRRVDVEKQKPRIQGAGRKNMVETVRRFLEICGGSIQVDRIDISKTNMQQVRDAITIIP